MTEERKQELIHLYLLPEGSKHICELPNEAITLEYGDAIGVCYEDDGRLFVSNNEYGNQVNFCPVCGFRATELIK